MIRDNWEQIKQNVEVRQNLSQIRQELKAEQNLESFGSMIEGEEEVLISLLQSEDAKTRKNVSLLMGDLGWQEFLEPVFTAYQNEEQRFVRSSYLAAMGSFDYSKYLNELKDCLKKLTDTEVTVENQKHIAEEMRELSSLVIGVEGVETHHFTGWNKPHDIILLTNRNFTSLTEEELMEAEPGAKTTLFGAGVRAQVNDLNWLNKVRTYQELLFIIKGMETSSLEITKLAEKIAESKFLSWLTANHDGQAPFYFRVEMKSKRPLDEKSAFVKKLSGQIERLTERKLTNSAANYEVELRVVENKEGNCNLLVKLFTFRDERFLYRKEFMPTSIKAVNGALTVSLAREYLKEGAQVLDPFCGVGTMLVERYKAVKANTTYGIDILEEAVLKARINTDAAGQIIHYINRDFFTFEHDYLFDEVITNMPFRIGRITDEEVEEIYRRFFKTISCHLYKGALLVLYSHNKELIQQYGPVNGFQVLKKYEISKREGTYVYLLRR